MHFYCNSFLRNASLLFLEPKNNLKVQEYYADYLAVNPEIFTLNLKNSLLVSAPIPRGPEYGPLQDQSSKMITRNVQGILSVLLSFKKKPIQIRYQGASSLARQVNFYLP